MADPSDTAASASEEAALNAWRLARRGWPMNVLHEGEIMICGEKVINGQRYLVATDDRLYNWDIAGNGWIDSGQRLADPEALPGDSPPEEPEMRPEDYLDAPDVAAKDLAELTPEEEE